MADKENVTALMTAESIVVGFLLVYASLINARVVDLRKASQPVFSTVLAGFVVYGLVLVAFRSLLLLFESIRASDFYDDNYNAGYALFLLVILASGFYVMMNTFSLVHYAIFNSTVAFCKELPTCESGPIYGTGLLTIVLVMVLVIIPVPLVKGVRQVRTRYRAWLKPCTIVSVFLAVICDVVTLLHFSELRFVWLIIFQVPTIVALSVVWMLMIPES